MTFNQVTENAIKFSFQPNSRKIIKIFFCILPAILLFSLTHSEFWLISLLVSVFLIIPYENKSFTYFPVIHILFSISMFLLTILQMLILNAFIPYSFFLSIFGIIVATGILCFPRFKPFLIWLLIGSVYTAFHFHKDHIFELNKILLVFGIAFLSSFFSYFIFMQNKKSLLKFKLKIVTKKFLTNLKTQQQKLNFISILIHSLSFGAALFISSAILFYFGLEEGQWLLWSTISVMQFELQESLVKSWARLKGVFIGGSIAFLLCILIPHTPFITLFFFILIPFTLVMFKNYTVAFATRSACVVLVGTSIDVSHYLFQYRLENVLIGACVGLCITLLAHLMIKKSKTNK